jgi:hypothetical protein
MAGTWRYAHCLHFLFSDIYLLLICFLYHISRYPRLCTTPEHHIFHAALSPVLISALAAYARVHVHSTTLPPPSLLLRLARVHCTHAALPSSPADPRSRLTRAGVSSAQGHPVPSTAQVFPRHCCTSRHRLLAPFPHLDTATRDRKHAPPLTTLCAGSARARCYRLWLSTMLTWRLRCPLGSRANASRTQGVSGWILEATV